MPSPPLSWPAWPRCRRRPRTSPRPSRCWATTRRSGAARAAAALGDRERARALADEDLAEAVRFGAPLSHGLALRTAGELAGGDRGIELLREAVGVLAASEARLEHALALASLGSALLAAGHRVAARAPLREAA